MIKLQISKDAPEQIALKERIEGLSLAREITTEESLEHPILTHSGKTYIGTQAITAYLDDFEQFHTQWYNCHCG